MTEALQHMSRPLEKGHQPPPPPGHLGPPLSCQPADALYRDR